MDEPEKREPQPRAPRPGGRLLCDVLRANVRALRDARGLSQQDLADRMVELGHSWHQTTAGRIERGLRGVSAEEAGGLAAALETTVVGLLDPLATEEPDYFIDLGPSAQPLSRRAARRLILNEDTLWDTTRREGLLVWHGNKLVVVRIPLDTEDALADALRALRAAGMTPEASREVVGSQVDAEHERDDGDQ